MFAKRKEIRKGLQKSIPMSRGNIVKKSTSDSVKARRLKNLAINRLQCRKEQRKQDAQKAKNVHKQKMKDDKDAEEKFKDNQETFTKRKEIRKELQKSIPMSRGSIVKKSTSDSQIGRASCRERV